MSPGNRREQCKVDSSGSTLDLQVFTLKNNFKCFFFAPELLIFSHDEQGSLELLYGDGGASESFAMTEPRVRILNFLLFSR